MVGAEGTGFGGNEDGVLVSGTDKWRDEKYETETEIESVGG